MPESELPATERVRMSYLVQVQSSQLDNQMQVLNKLRESEPPASDWARAFGSIDLKFFNNCKHTTNEATIRQRICAESCSASKACPLQLLSIMKFDFQSFSSREAIAGSSKTARAGERWTWFSPRSFLRPRSTSGGVLLVVINHSSNKQEL
jgi:hypothetical protein